MNVDHKNINRNWITTFFMAALVLLLAASPCDALFGGRVKSFSADNVEIAPNGKVVNTSKIYMTPDAIRMDGMPGAGGRGMHKVNLTMLILKKQNRQFIYNHDKKLVFESPVDEENLKAGYKAMDNIESEKVLGKEKVAGYRCVKKEVITSHTVMGQRYKNKLIVWESDRFEFPLKTRNDEGAVQEMRNIKTGKPSKKLFRPLSGYKKVNNMMMVMGMDFAAMGKRDTAKSTEEKPQANPENIEDMDIAQVIARMKQAMGKNADPEAMAQMEQIMTRTMAQKKQTRRGKGAAGELWKIIPRRAGDKIGYEMKAHNTIDVILGTQSDLRQVFDFYGKKLKAKGWKDGGTYIRDGRGTMNMRKGDQTVMFAWADNPGMQGGYKLFYNVHYTGAEK